MFELFLFFMNHDTKRYKTRLGPQTLQLLLFDSFLQIFRGATCRGEWKEVSSTLFWKLKRSAPILRKNTLIVFICGLNLSSNCCFKSIWEKNFRNFPFGAFLSCALDKLFIEMQLFQETSPALSCPLMFSRLWCTITMSVLTFLSCGTRHQGEPCRKYGCTCHNHASYYILFLLEVNWMLQMSDLLVSLPLQWLTSRSSLGEDKSLDSLVLWSHRSIGCIFLHTLRWSQRTVCLTDLE